MDDSSVAVFTPAERRLFESLEQQGVRSMIVGLSAAVLQGGIPLRVLDLRRILASKRATARPKDLAAIPALEEALAALEDADE